MAVGQIQTTTQEPQVRAVVEQAMAAQGGQTVQNQEGQLVMDLGGSVGSAYLAGGFRNKMKMPMRLVMSTASGEAGTGVTVDVHSRGTGSGIMSGGWLGAMKQDKAERAWVQVALNAITAQAAGPTPQAHPPVTPGA
jgi:hypothetical protein